jgi:hypothetical protein
MDRNVVEDELEAPVPAKPISWRDRFDVLWEAHQERERRRRILGEWRRGTIQVISASAAILGLFKLVLELSRAFLGR